MYAIRSYYALRCGLPAEHGDKVGGHPLPLRVVPERLPQVIHVKGIEGDPVDRGGNRGVQDVEPVRRQGPGDLREQAALVWAGNQDLGCARIWKIRQLYPRGVPVEFPEDLEVVRKPGA